MAIINTYGQLKAASEAGFDKRGLVAVGYYGRPSGRMGIGQVSKWQVSSPFFQTDPNAPWYDYGNKAFPLYGNGETPHQRKMNTLAKAQAWAESEYGIKEWVKNRMGDYVPKEVNDKFPIPKREK